MVGVVGRSGSLTGFMILPRLDRRNELVVGSSDGKGQNSAPDDAAAVRAYPDPRVAADEEQSAEVITPSWCRALGHIKGWRIGGNRFAPRTIRRLEHPRLLWDYSPGRAFCGAAPLTAKGSARRIPPTRPFLPG